MQTDGDMAVSGNVILLRHFGNPTKAEAEAYADALGKKIAELRQGHDRIAVIHEASELENLGVSYGGPFGEMAKRIGTQDLAIVTVVPGSARRITGRITAILANVDMQFFATLDQALNWLNRMGFPAAASFKDLGGGGDFSG